MREALREGERELKVAIIAMMKSQGGREGVIYSLLIWPDRRSESPIHAFFRSATRLRDRQREESNS